MRLRFASLLILLIAASSAHAGVWMKHVLVNGFDNARGVHTFDIDADGDEDVIGCCRYGNTVAWWENLGTSFAMHEIDTSFAGAWSVQAGDIDGDGDGDILAAAIVEDQMAWWENPSHPDSTWERHVILPMYLSKGVYPVDIDEDGDLDVIGASSGDDVFTLSTNDGTGNFTHEILSGTDGARMVHAADLNGDGAMDIIGSSGAANRVGWFAQSDTGWVGDVIITQWEGSRSAIGADMDGDGDNDIVACARFEDTVVWWENDGTGQGWDTHVIDPDILYPRSLHPIDMDFDGDIDVVSHSNTQNYVNWYENLGNDEWQEHLIGANFQGAMHVRAADLDNDGDYDVAAAAADKNQIAFWEWVESDDPVTVEAVPAESPYEIGAEGDTVRFDVLANTEMNFTEDADLWTMLVKPGDQNELLDNHVVTLEPGETVEELDREWIASGDLPPGFYTIKVLIGNYPDNTLFEDSFIVQKMSTWVEKHGSPSHVRDYALSAGWPNPFNPTTTVNVNLPAPGPLDVRVFNLAGREVAVLAEGAYTPGVHRFLFDASHLPSGSYYVRAHVPGRFNQTQRVTLLK